MEIVTKYQILAVTRIRTRPQSEVLQSHTLPTELSQFIFDQFKLIDTATQYYNRETSNKQICDSFFHETFQISKLVHRLQHFVNRKKLLAKKT